MATLVADILLVIVLFSLLPIVPMALSMRNLAGPDRTGADIGYFMLGVPRWIAMAVVFGILAARGEFSWIVKTRTTAWVIVMIAHACVGLLVMGSTLLSGDRSGKFEAFKNLALIPPIVVPLLVVVYGFVLLHTDQNPLWMRIVLGTISIAAILAAAVWGLKLARERMKSIEAENQAAWEQEDERAREREAEFSALPPDAPLGQLLRFGGLGDTDALRARAIAAITSRPNHLRELAECLRNDWRGEAMQYVRFSVNPPYPPELAQPVRDALTASAADVRKKATPIAYTHPDDYDWDCFAAVELADKFAGMGVDFREPIQAMLDAINASPNKDIALRGRVMLAEWLKRH